MGRAQASKFGATMQAWKSLLIILPAGLLLGIAGGHLARPVIQRRGDGAAWRKALLRRGSEYRSAGDPMLGIDPTTYTASQDFAASLAQQAMAAWPQPYDDLSGPGSRRNRLTARTEPGARPADLTDNPSADATIATQPEMEEAIDDVRRLDAHDAEVVAKAAQANARAAHATAGGRPQSLATAFR